VKTELALDAFELALWALSRSFRAHSAAHWSSRRVRMRRGTYATRYRYEQPQHRATDVHSTWPSD
jgi:hypothetical protein